MAQTKYKEEEEEEHFYPFFVIKLRQGTDVLAGHIVLSPTLRYFLALTYYSSLIFYVVLLDLNILFFEEHARLENQILFLL